VRPRTLDEPSSRTANSRSRARPRGLKPAALLISCCTARWRLWRLLSFVLFTVVTAAAQDSQPAGSQPASQSAARDLVFNGDFEILDTSGTLPAGWTTTHPDNVRLIDLGGWHGHVIEMTGGKKLMASYGVDLTGEKIAVKANTRYRCTGHTRSSGPNMKVFIKGYATVTRRIKGELKTFDDIVYQMRKDIQPSEDWQPFDLEFAITPAEVFSDFQQEVQYVRIRLWAFWPVGTCWFDEIAFEEVGPVPNGDRRHGDAVTHVGLPPRLGEAADDVAAGPRTGRTGPEAGTSSTRPAADAAFDEEQTWREAANALRTNEHAKAALLAEELIAHAPQKGVYRVLAARALVELERWEEAERQAGWLLEEADQSSDGGARVREVEPWQRDWARVVQARVRLHTGRADEARTVLRQVVQASASPHAAAAASRLLAQIEDDQANE
jgi:hypothetical protein